MNNLPGINPDGSVSTQRMADIVGTPKDDITRLIKEARFVAQQYQRLKKLPYVASLLNKLADALAANSKGA